MPRYRKLHVKTVESLDINDMPDDFTRLMWVLLPLGLCREGRGIDNPAWIKSKLFPMRLDVSDCGEMMEQRAGIDAWPTGERPGDDLTPEQVKEAAAADWGEPPEEPPGSWAYWSARIFIETCAEHNLGVRFSW